MKEKNQTHWAILEIAEQEAPRHSIDLWPQIKAGMTSLANKNRGSTMRTRITFALAILLLVFVSLGFVPGVRAIAEEIVQRMGIAFVDTSQFGEEVQVTEAEMIRVTPRPSLSLEEIRQRIAFPLLVPTWVPEGLLYVHRSISEYDPNEWEGSGQKVTITYWRTADFDFKSGVLYFNANDGPISAPPLLADSRQQPVIVNGQPGIYVHGGWTDDGGGDPNTKMGILQWDDEIDSAFLTWEQDGVIYLLQAHYLGLELDDLLQIAVSMSE